MAKTIANASNDIKKKVNRTEHKISKQVAIETSMNISFLISSYAVDISSAECQEGRESNIIERLFISLKTINCLPAAMLTVIIAAVIRIKDVKLDSNPTSLT